MDVSAGYSLFLFQNLVSSRTSLGLQWFKDRHYANHFKGNQLQRRTECNFVQVSVPVASSGAFLQDYDAFSKPEMEEPPARNGAQSPNARSPCLGPLLARCRPLRLRSWEGPQTRQKSAVSCKALAIRNPFWACLLLVGVARPGADISVPKDVFTVESVYSCSCLRVQCQASPHVMHLRIIWSRCLAASK